MDIDQALDAVDDMRTRARPLQGEASMDLIFGWAIGDYAKTHGVEAEPEYEWQFHEGPQPAAEWSVPLAPMAPEVPLAPQVIVGGIIPEVGAVASQFPNLPASAAEPYIEVARVSNSLPMPFQAIGLSAGSPTAQWMAAGEPPIGEPPIAPRLAGPMPILPILGAAVMEGGFAPGIAGALAEGAVPGWAANFVAGAGYGAAGEAMADIAVAETGSGAVRGMAAAEYGADVGMGIGAAEGPAAAAAIDTGLARRAEVGSAVAAAGVAQADAANAYEAAAYGGAGYGMGAGGAIATGYAANNAAANAAAATAAAADGAWGADGAWHTGGGAVVAGVAGNNYADANAAAAAHAEAVAAAHDAASNAAAGAYSSAVMHNAWADDAKRSAASPQLQRLQQIL
jgi:hypothetical protein